LFFVVFGVFGLPKHARSSTKSPTKSSSSAKSTKSTKTKSSKTSTGKARSSKKSGGTATRKTSTKSGTKSKRKGKKRRTRRKRVSSWRSGQREPTPERYREIQQALIDKGYLQSPASGAWGPESVEALKRFQQDQKIDASGKLDSMSLISLGLGPKRDVASQNGRVPPPQPTKEEKP